MHFQYYINHHLSQYEDQDKDKERTHLNVNTGPCWAPHRRSLENYFGINSSLEVFSRCFLNSRESAYANEKSAKKEAAEMQRKRSNMIRIEVCIVLT